MYAYKDLTGMKFGKLQVIEKTEIRKNRKIVWKCLCDCGNTAYVPSSDMLSGNTKSCGCGKNEGHPKYGKTASHKIRLYNIWAGMKDRCNREKNKSYRYYGARGIKVCEEWENDFIAFRNWALKNGYRDNLTIERKDNNKGYSPNNCTFATMKQQSNNRRNGAYISYGGERHTIAEWSDILGIKQQTFRVRLWKGMSFEKAIKKPDLRAERWK